MQRQDGGKFSRKSERALLRIPIRIAGKDSLGNAFDEMTFTLLVNRTGGLITTSHPLVPGSTITITNPSNKISCLFRVISRAPKSLSGSPEWGVECLEPEAEIWGVSFPTRPEEAAPADLIHVLLECHDCSAREMVALTLAQYRKLLAKSSMPRPCPKCHATREWKFGFIEVELERVAPGPAAPSALGSSTPGGSEKRRDRRLVVKLPLGIRLPDGRGETSKTENISESGLCFACSLNMQVGDLVYVTVGLDTTGAQHDTPGRITWRRPDQEKGMTFYGIKLEKSA